MTNLYEGKMAAIYDAMYQSFIDYDQEFSSYFDLIKQYKCQSVLEIGSGTGNLAKRFWENQFEYYGLDFSQSMILIAQNRNPETTFIHADMRDFELKKKVDAIIITGRSSSYLLSNQDVNNAFQSIYKNLNNDGMLIFDIVDANRFVPFFTENKNVIHQASFDGTNYLRESNWELEAKDNFLVRWKAQYFTIENQKRAVFFEDESTVRVFTINEIQLFLWLHGFEILQTIDRKTYAYDTYIIVARKIQGI